MKKHTSILVYGYGNPGRQDDGLGKVLIDKAELWVEKERLPNITLDVNYQLQVEDITNMHDKDVIIFVDASMEESVEHFLITPLHADEQDTFSMHAISPAYLLALCQKIYGHYPPAYMLHIRGYEWNINENITPTALQNLENAWNLLKKVLREPTLLLEQKHTLLFRKSKIQP